LYVSLDGSDLVAFDFYSVNRGYESCKNHQRVGDDDYYRVIQQIALNVYSSGFCYLGCCWFCPAALLVLLLMSIIVVLYIVLSEVVKGIFYKREDSEK
jgi:hypothetical protein